MHKIIFYFLCLFCFFSQGLANDNNNDSDDLNINDKELEEILKLIENDHTAPVPTPIEEPFQNDNSTDQNNKNNENNNDNKNGKNSEKLSPNKENYDDISKAIEQTDKKDLENKNIDAFEQKILEDFKSSDIITGINAGILMLYQKISNIFLYPVLLVFMFVILILFLLLTIYICVLYKNDKIEMMKIVLFYYLFLIVLLFDLFFLLYENSRFTLVFFTFSKDIILCFITFFIGVFLGKRFLKTDFEKRIIP